MAKVEFTKGTKCKKCGRIDLPPWKGHILCQSCGAQIIEGHNPKGGYIISQNAEIITVKVTHKLFKDIYEEVK